MRFKPWRVKEQGFSSYLHDDERWVCNQPVMGFATGMTLGGERNLFLSYSIFTLLASQLSSKKKNKIKYSSRWNDGFRVQVGFQAALASIEHPASRGKLLDLLGRWCSSSSSFGSPKFVTLQCKREILSQCLGCVPVTSEMKKFPFHYNQLIIWELVGKSFQLCTHFA